MTWTVNILTLFPEMFPGTLGQSLAGQGLEKGLWQLNVVNMRNFAEDKHQTVDDIPYGGGAGMVLKPDVVAKAIESLGDNLGELIYLSPRGQPFDQQQAKKMAKKTTITLICGRYEGIDERVLEHFSARELSIGDYVLSGGEVAAQVVMDACIRLIPEIMGSQDTLTEESFENGLLEYPHYTRPQLWAGKKVPDVLLSGHHGEIKKWRQEQAEDLTKTRRPDLWQAHVEANKNE